MNLLVTTSQSLLLLDTDSGAAHLLDSGRGLYYGLAHDGEHLYVAARNRLVSSEQPAADERGEILVFDRALRPCPSLRAPFPLRDLHEIAWHGGKLWATCSHDNLVAIYDGGNWEQWYPLGDPQAGDANHFNSFMFDDEHVWILAHNRGPSELMAFSLRTRERVKTVNLGNCGHNIWCEDGQLFSCSSAESRLLSDGGFQLETGGFPRGVAFDALHRCVGVSALSERKARDFNTGQLMVYLRDWRLQHVIDLDDEGLVLDLLALPPGFRLNGEATLWHRLSNLWGGQPPQAVRKSFTLTKASA
ncbi:MAG: hypothetical protein V4724_26165 [Pseudomonadota bacterium]